MTAAKKEMIQKTALDLVTVLNIMHYAEANTDNDWDIAAGYFYGASGKSDYTIYGRAEKRCANYGTCTGDGGEAMVNTAIGQALDGKDSAKLKKYIQVLYSQNVLRYANKIDQNMGSDDLPDYIAEGQAFWRILSIWLTDSTAVKVFDRMFSTVLNPQAANNYNYCIAKKYIDEFITSISATSDLGSLSEVPSGVTCASDLAPSLVTKIETDAGDYTLKTTGSTNDIGGALQYSEAVKKVVNLVDGGSGTDIATAFETSSLKGIAEQDGEDTADTFTAHHGSATWMSAIITDATSAVSSYSTAGAKAEAIEKTMMDSIAMQSIIADLEHATHTATPPHSTEQKNAYWDSAAAKYFGTSDARSYAMYTRANKRGANYGQLMGSGAYSATNKAILDAFNGAVSEANANIIVENLKVIYTQSTLRYVFKFNENLANGDDWTGNRAEAFAFYNNIAPYVKAADAAGHEAIAAFLNPTVDHSSCNNYHYCKAKSVLQAYDTAVWNLVGTFESDDEVTCPATLPASGVIGCSGSSATPAPSSSPSPAGNSTSPPPPPPPLILDDDDAGERPGVAGVFIALAIIALVNV